MRYPPTHLISLCPSLSPSFLCPPPPFFFSLPLPPTHLSCSLSSAWPGLRCLPPSCIPPALRWALACLERGGTGNVDITQLPTHIKQLQTSQEHLESTQTSQSRGLEPSRLQQRVFRRGRGLTIGGSAPPADR